MADDQTERVDIDQDSEPIDIAAGVDKISADLFPESVETAPTPQETVTEALTAPATAPTKTVAPLPTIRQAPKSWAKDVHPVWEKIDPKGQDYIEKREKDFLDGLEQYKGAAQYGKSMQDVVTPYLPLIQAKGLDAPRAVADMLASYAELSQGSLEQRQAAFARVGKHFGITLPPPTNGTELVTQIDPRIQTLEQQFQQLNQVLTQQQTAALQAAKEKASQEVTAFASDAKNAFFDECHEDIVKFIKAGDSLQEAYDKAVWANPVTREKSKQTWFQTETEKAKERARLDALPKQKARGVNVKSQDTQRPPTDPLGSMEDTLRSTLKDMKQRTVH